jgi:ubiquinone/menaquinone biosynthesis C-methylase UbiE
MVQADFWSNNPCGVDGNLSRVIEQRYRMEPWLPRELRTIPNGLGKYLEVGCGQGVDSYFICSNLNNHDDYTAIDFSPESVGRAEKYLIEAGEVFDLKTKPVFSHGDVLNLNFKDAEFDFVYSMGVIHHTPNPQQAINEVFRVLKSGGQAKIFLYRRNSLKVGVAKSLRLLQMYADKALSKKRSIYSLLSTHKTGFFGSMFLECFGVPQMEWYSKKELEDMFAKFSSLNIKPYGFNFPKSTSAEIDGYNPNGYFFMVDVTK